MAYIDLLTDSGEEKAWVGLYVYYPSGDPSVDRIFVPVTAFLTLVPGTSVDADVAWHSLVGYSGERKIRSYLNDAIALHDENSAKWDR